MKLVVFGGAGDMGSYIVKDAIKSDIWSKITIADINEKKAMKIIDKLADSRLQYIKVDAMNTNELVSIFTAHDIACSAIGPFYIFGSKLAKAAIEAKVPLIDICDDSGPTMEILEMDEAAKKVKIPIFLGYGWTPGLTNLLVKQAYNKLDKNHPMQFDIFWAGGAADSEGLAVIMHVLYAVTGDFPSYQNGKHIDVPAGKGNVYVDFPEPLGTIGVFDCGHPEPVTIPQFLPEVSRCTLKGGLTPDWNNKFAGSMKQLHLTQGKNRKAILAKLVHWTEGIFATGGIAASSARVDIYGYYNGKNVHWVYCTPSVVMGELTGFTASVAAELYAKGKLKGVGVLPPETVSEPKLFFDELQKRNIEMIFDESEPLKKFKIPQPFTPGFISKYGLTLIILVVLVTFLTCFGWIIISLL